jgi:hypothetical protein
MAVASISARPATSIRVTQEVGRRLALAAATAYDIPVAASG